MSRAVVLSIVAVLVSDLFVAGGYAKYLWIPLAFGPVLLRLARVEADEELGVEEFAQSGRPRRLVRA
jgi:hypothetical protein